MKLSEILKGTLLGGVVLPLSAAVAGAELATVTTMLNVRTGPGTNYRVMGALPTGTTVDVIQCEGNWCQVRLKGPDGWASSRYLAFQSAPAPSSPLYLWWLVPGVIHLLHQEFKDDKPRHPHHPPPPYYRRDRDDMRPHGHRPPPGYRPRPHHQQDARPGPGARPRPDQQQPPRYRPRADQRPPQGYRARPGQRPGTYPWWWHNRR
ncbi:SH3 domain-containing protein [Rhodovulum adriaticum]|uniref:Uncharacterized protein YraI n=1 Tax=Rhodovulum adriaticum TaxID=35804 RepID=A0A4R2NJB4_RHOAD|nr:SH3 domain-containing protein [Rhodovulum adriaticum]MBK1635857.1 hypothetical protein [Rhodovulum adriaticum]TCP21398.1 uncharacterized protein YraI [Rhodovulum adriaticum]